jgi:hypothetical protein
VHPGGGENIRATRLQAQLQSHTSVRSHLDARLLLVADFFLVVNIACFQVKFYSKCSPFA